MENYSIAEACRLSTLSKSTLYRAMEAGRLPFRKVGRRTIIPADGLRKFIGADAPAEVRH
jgi:excisionase family DNA binding protein